VAPEKPTTSPDTNKKIRPARRGSPRQIEVLKLTKGTPQSQYGTCWEHPNAGLGGVSMQMIEYAEAKNFVEWRNVGMLEVARDAGDGQ